MTNSLTTLINTIDLISLDCNKVIFDCRFDLMNPEAGQQAYEAGHAPRLYLRATHQKTLEIVSLDVLKQFALDLS